MTVVEVGLTSIIDQNGSTVVNLCGRLTLEGTAQVIREAKLFVGIDSGPSHMANALRCPSLVLLGSYHQFKSYMPYTGYLRENEQEMLIRWPGPSAAIPYELVWGRLRSAVIGGRHRSTTEPQKCLL
jgi:lipopolysaccharide heptosyltransferase III